MGVILRTSPGPDAFEPEVHRGVVVDTDGSFEETVFSGLLTDSGRTAAHDYTVEADLVGRLDADTEYDHCFVFDGAASRVPNGDVDLLGVTDQYRL